MGFKNLPRPLSRLFGTAAEDPPAAPDPSAALDPTAALDSAAPQRLVAAALEGGDEALRAAATAKLTDSESLRTLAGLRAGTASGVPAGVERAAQERLAQLVDAGTLEFETLGVPPVNVSALLAVAGYSSDPERVPGILA